MFKILICSNNDQSIQFFTDNFSKNFNLTYLKNLKDLKYPDTGKNFDFIILDHQQFNNSNQKKLTKQNVLDAIGPIKKHFFSAKIILLAERKFTQDCIMAIKNGVDNYINFPLISEEIQYIIESEYEALKLESELNYLKKELHTPMDELVFNSNSPTMNEIFDQVLAVSKTKSTVLLTGESGTGKSFLAKYIHDLSNRKSGPFIRIHCGTIPENLVESELFGHEKGSFTGAIRRKLGKFELANNGTIFLDEIGTISPPIQVKLLQVIQERFIQRIGGTNDIKVDVRIIAATNENLPALVSKGKFREDLFYRLNVFPLEITPLRNRLGDLDILTKSILKRLNNHYGREIEDIDPNVKTAFLNYSWPGNIRELENLLERAYVLEKSKVLTPENFPKVIFEKTKGPKTIIPIFNSFNLNEARKEINSSFERTFIQKLLTETKGNLILGANMANVTVRQLQKLLKKHKIQRKDFY